MAGLSDEARELIQTNRIIQGTHENNTSGVEKLLWKSVLGKHI